MSEFVEGRYYTFDMARAMRKVKKPFTFTLDVAEDDHGLNLLVYESEVKPMNDADRYKMMEYLLEVAYLLESYGPKVNIQGVPGAPRRL